MRSTWPEAALPAHCVARFTKARDQPYEHTCSSVVLVVTCTWLLQEEVERPGSGSRRNTPVTIAALPSLAPSILAAIGARFQTAYCTRQGTVSSCARSRWW
jgi:hypothetical protein